MANGFVDLQVNGWLGTDFSAPGLTEVRVREIVRALAARGTVAFCPTLITGDPDVYRENLGTLARAAADPATESRILGIHLEGPFIAATDGARGAHPARFVRPPSIDDFEQYQQWAQGMIRILTVAPEIEGAAALIRHAARQGVTVCLGHHLADAVTLQNAVMAGARASTHLGNGIPSQIDRHQNPLWWQLACDDLQGLFITDGHHLPDPLIRVALRAKTVKRFIVTSDASPLAGMPPGNYRAFGLEVTLSETGRIHASATGTLAGSHATMLECMNHLASLRELDEADLWRVGRDNPLQLIQQSPERLRNLPGPDVHYDGTRFHLPEPSTHA